MRKVVNKQCSASSFGLAKKINGLERTSYGFRVFVCIDGDRHAAEVNCLCQVFYLRFGLKGAKRWQANQFRTSRQNQGHHIVLTRTVNTAKSCVECMNKSRGAVQITVRKPWSAGKG